MQQKHYRFVLHQNTKRLHHNARAAPVLMQSRSADIACRDCRPPGRHSRPLGRHFRPAARSSRRTCRCFGPLGRDSRPAGRGRRPTVLRNATRGHRESSFASIRLKTSSAGCPRDSAARTRAARRSSSESSSARAITSRTAAPMTEAHARACAEPIALLPFRAHELAPRLVARLSCDAS